MAEASTSSGHTAAETLKAYEDEDQAQIATRSEARRVRGDGQRKRAQVETAVIGHLKAMREQLDRKLQELKTTQESHVAKVKSDIEAQVVSSRPASTNWEPNSKARRSRRPS